MKTTTKLTQQELSAAMKKVMNDCINAGLDNSGGYHPENKQICEQLECSWTGARSLMLDIDGLPSPKWQALKMAMLNFIIEQTNNGENEMILDLNKIISKFITLPGTGRMKFVKDQVQLLSDARIIKCTPIKGNKTAFICSMDTVFTNYLKA